jgi:hypothetical protein
MKVRNIRTGEMAEREWKGAVLVVKETGEGFRCNPLMREYEGDPAGPRLGLPNGGRGFFLDKNLKPVRAGCNRK